MSISPPPYRDKDLTGQSWQKWFASITDALKTTAGTLTAWSSIDKTGSNLNELTTRNHTDLQNLNSPSYTHLTGSQYQSLTGGGNTNLHSHDASMIAANVIPGRDGEDGIDGSNGIDGKDGRDGRDGVNGQ